jgi:hypothetical protein
MGTALLTWHLVVGAAVGGAWTDESFIGRGPMGSAGVAASIGDYLQVEGLVDAGHFAQGGGTNFATRANAIGGRGRVLFRLGGKRWAVRPFVGVGATATHWRGEFTRIEYETDNAGRIVREGPVTRAWRTTSPGFELSGGAEIRGGRIGWRPEFALRLSTNGGLIASSTAEPPFATISVGLTAVWR